MPQISEERFIRGKEPYVWRACPICGKERWVRKWANKVGICRSCSSKNSHPVRELPDGYIRKYKSRNLYKFSACGNCGEARLVPVIRGETVSRYCKKCAGILAKRNGLRKGNKNGHWAGGRHKNAGGYVLVYNSSHPRAKSKNYVLEHILVWEKANKKFLPNDVIIHHLNGVRDDNRIENLVALKKKDHPTRTFIPLLQERIRELEYKAQLLVDDYCIIEGEK